MPDATFTAKADRSGLARLNRRSVLLGAGALISSACVADAQASAPKLIVLPKGVTSPVRFNMLSPKGPQTIISRTNIPLEGFLVCNGAAVSRTDYKELFEAIGTRYGAGDGRSTFNLAHYPVKYTAGRLVSGMATCPSSSLGLPVGVVLPFELHNPFPADAAQKPQ